MKEESIGAPDIYLGGKLSQVVLANGVKAWGFSSSKYVQQAVKDAETHLRDTDRKLLKKASTPLSPNYRPELDISDE